MQVQLCSAGFKGASAYVPAQAFVCDDYFNLIGSCRETIDYAIMPLF